MPRKTPCSGEAHQKSEPLATELTESLLISLRDIATLSQLCTDTLESSPHQATFYLRAALSKISQITGEAIDVLDRPRMPNGAHEAPHQAEREAHK